METTAVCTAAVPVLVLGMATALDLRVFVWC